MLLMRNGAEVFIPHPEDRDDQHRCWTGSTSGESEVSKWTESDGEILIFPGPLTSAKTQKLMRFIQGKCQDLLPHLDKPENQKSYIFWSIMEHFCNRNGRVMIPEIATLLFKGYGLLRKKLRRVENQEDWCLPLAEHLCSCAPEHKHRGDIIKLGDKFASRGWMYAAQICYVVAQMNLGSRRCFELIGCDRSVLTKCDSELEKKTIMKEAMERTEVYEYMLSLTLGCNQPHFQKFKYIYACDLAESGLEYLALDYCKNIAEEILRFPQKHKFSMVENLIMRFEDLLQATQKEEPECLRELRQLLDESHPAARLKFQPSQHTEFDARYAMRELLEQGSFNPVYAGFRKVDGKQVTIKCAAKRASDEFITIPGDTHRLPVEVALLKMVSKPPNCRNVVVLLDWFETSDFFILVLESPNPCVDLRQFCKINSNCLPEAMAQVIMQQVVEAARHCCDRGVLHQDIKPENILINPFTLEVKLINFGYGELLTNELYNSYRGTPDFCPPEWVLHRSYSGVPATVWSLGILLFYLVCGHLPCNSELNIVQRFMIFSLDLSIECCDLISQCLTEDPNFRPTFRKILNHVWFLTRDVRSFRPW